MSSSPDTIARPVPPRGAPKKKEEGAVMLAVMLLLMMSTLTGLVALQSSTFELRAVGTERRALQTHYVAESALVTTLALVDVLRPEVIRVAMAQSPVATSTRIATEEPATAREITNYRLYMSDYASFAGVVGSVVETDPGRGASLGPMLGVAPDFAVDVNDDYLVSRPIAGARSDGYGELRYMMATYTARGRTRPPLDAYDPGEVAALGAGARGLHETAANARAYAISGPFPWED
jgi:hypothetical protein